MMNKYQDILGRINFGLFLAVVALLPFPQVFLRYAWVLWFAAWVLEGRWLQLSNLKAQITNSKIIIPICLFALWYVWRLLSGIWSPDHVAWARQMERYITFGVVVPVGLWGVNACYNWKLAAKVLIGGCVAAVFIYVVLVTALYFRPDWVAAFNYPEWGHYPDLFHYYENISHFKHRLFLCGVELFGAVMAWLLYRKKPAILIPSLVVMLSVIPLTGSRQAILTLAALIVVVVLCSLSKQYLLRYGVVIAIVGALGGWGLLSLHPRMENFDISDVTVLRQIDYTHDVRFNIWGFALQHPKDYIAHGLGAGQSQNYMRERYSKGHYPYYAERGYNTHNQYLEELLELGIGGLLFFLIAWLSIPLCTKKEGQQTALLFTTLFLFNMCTECVFGRYDGIALWAAGMVFILMQCSPYLSNSPRK